MSSCLLAGCGVSPKQESTRARGQAFAAVASAFAEARSEQRAEAHARYALGILHDLNQEPEEANEEYFRAALADPTNETLVMDLSRRLLDARQTDKAIELLQRATATPGNTNGGLLARLGSVYALAGKTNEALEANQSAIKKSPRLLIGYQNLALLRWQGGQRDETLKVLDQAAKVSDADAEFLLGLARLYANFSQGGVPDLKPRVHEVLDRVRKLNPKSPLLLQRLAEEFMFIGEGKAAAEIYLRLVEQFPNSLPLRERLVNLFLQNDNAKAAAEQMEKLILEEPTKYPIVYFFLGELASRNKKPQQAIDYFQKGLVINPGFEAGYYDLAAAQINANEPKAAQATLARIREKFEPGFRCEFFGALACVRLKDYAGAVARFTAAEVFARARETNRLDADFYFRMGAAYERITNYVEAENCFLKSLAYAPNFTEALNYLGYMWADRGVNLDKAQEMIEKAVRLEPKNAAFLDSLAWVFFKQGHPKEALPYVLKALDYNEEPDATLHDHLGDIYEALQEPEKARAAWQKSLAIEANDQIRKKLVAVPASKGLPR